MEQRNHGLDAVRAFALIAGIVLHGTMSFVSSLKAMGYPISDRSTSLTLEVVCYVIHSFRMTVFFMIAGFFAHMAFHRKGTMEFARDRARRIVTPLIVGWLVLAPLTIAVIAAAAYINTGEVPTAPAGGLQQQSGIPLIHLWFLYYLTVFYVLALLIRNAIVGTIDRGGALRGFADRVIRVLVNGYVAPILLAIPTVAILYLVPGWAWSGIPTPDVGLTPKLPALVAYGSPFVFGWLLHRQTPLLAKFEQRWLLHLALAIILSAAAWRIVGAPMPLMAPVPEPIKLAYALLYAVAGWMWMFAVVGIALKFFAAASRVTRYLADASYWMYLVHLPLVLALQTSMMNWDLHWIVKFPLLMAVTFAILLLSYHYLVRNTFIGTYLNGRRYAAFPSPQTQAQSHA
jgi:glucan biosynthesis protein C